MDIKRSVNKGVAEHRVSAAGVEITLSALATDLKPITFGLYIWTLPFDREKAILTEAVEKITGAKVKSVSYFAGNGHGDVQVKYSDQ